LLINTYPEAQVPIAVDEVQVNALLAAPVDEE